MLPFEFIIELPGGVTAVVTRNYGPDLCVDGRVIPMERHYPMPLSEPGVIGELVTGPREWSPGTWPDGWVEICAVERGEKLSLKTDFYHFWRDTIEKDGKIGFLPKTSKFLKKWGKAQS